MARKKRSRRRKTRIKQKQTRIYAKTKVLGFAKDLNRPYKSRKIRHKRRIIQQLRERQRLSLLRDRRRRLRMDSKPLLIKNMQSPIIQQKKTVCEARVSRQQILHALRKTGKSGQKRPTYRNKHIKCKRK